MDKVLWMNARPDAPVLPFPSAIVNTKLEIDPWFEFPVGEVPGAARPYLHKTVPAGIDGKHYCGTPEQFLHGDTINGRVPTVRYGASGWPLCCQPPHQVLGGLGLGGLSKYAVVPALNPGPVCEQAQLAEIGVPYTWTWTPSADQWWYWNVVEGQQYRVSFSLAIFSLAPVAGMYARTDDPCGQIIGSLAGVVPTADFTAEGTVFSLDVTSSPPQISYVYTVRLDPL